ncbi:hypothetical protein AK812_SmicGene45781, partial [Symbiodinium microadriaticum]
MSRVSRSLGIIGKLARWLTHRSVPGEQLFFIFCGNGAQLPVRTDSGSAKMCESVLIPGDARGREAIGHRHLKPKPELCCTTAGLCCLGSGCVHEDNLLQRRTAPATRQSVPTTMSDYLSTGGVRSPEILINTPRPRASTPVSKDELFLEGYGRQFGEKMTYSVP